MEEIGPQADGRQVLINDDRLMITDFVHTENADDAEVRRRTVWWNVNHRNLNGGPQADGGGERQLENNKYPQMSQMDTDLEPVARIIKD